MRRQHAARQPGSKERSPVDFCPEFPQLAQRGLELAEQLEGFISVQCLRAYRQHRDRATPVFDELGDRQIGHRSHHTRTGVRYVKTPLPTRREMTTAPGVSVPVRMSFTAAELTEIRHAFRERLS
jgi:hypothetical protein